MAIPASHIVEVMPRVIEGGSNDLEMNGLLITASPLISTASLVLEFPGAATVGRYFGIDSEEYAAAVVYFSGFQNRTTSPRKLFIGRRIAGNVAGWLRGAPLSKDIVSQFPGIADGAFVINVDNTAVSVSGVNLSTLKSFSEAAAAMQTALTSSGSAATVTWSSVTQAFTFTSATIGEASSVSFASAPATGTDLASLFRLGEGMGGVLSPGMNALTHTAQMEAFRTASENWVCFTHLGDNEDDIIAYAAWANANYGWLYVPHSTDANIPLDAGNDEAFDPATRLKSLGYDHTAIVFGGLDYAMFIMGSVASVDWGRTNGSITFAFKRQSGLAATITDEYAASTLDAKNCNYMGDFATRNANFVFLYQGCLSASDYRFIDPYINSVWLNNRIQVALMDGLTRTGRVPYTPRGYTMVRSWMLDPVQAAINNGVIENGVELSELQKTELQNEAGRDISNELAINGYVIQILDPGAATRAQRQSPVVNLWYTYGGAVHRIEVASTAVL